MEQEVINRLSKIHGCRFVSLKYQSKESGEVSRYLIGMGANLDRVYRRDERVMRLVQPTNPLQEQAKKEILDSLRESLKVGIGQNSKYTCKDTYTNLFNGAKFHNQTKDIYLSGFLIRKEVLIPGEYKEVKSKPLTIEKQKLRRRMKLNKIRLFALSNVKRIAFEGNKLTLE
jgi:hypothetical protein